MQGQLPCTGCTACGVLTAARGTISDGSGPLDYGNDATCIWIIAPHGAAQVTLDVTELDMEESYDFLRLYSCESTACGVQQFIAELTGNMSNAQSFTSSTGYLRVHFSSDVTVTRGGFTASWSSSSVPAPQPTPATLIVSHLV